MLYLAPPIPMEKDKPVRRLWLKLNCHCSGLLVEESGGVGRSLYIFFCRDQTKVKLTLWLTPEAREEGGKKRRNIRQATFCWCCSAAKKIFILEL
jgi:hypothetical protein